jgi:hypothetical protein
MYLISHLKMVYVWSCYHDRYQLITRLNSQRTACGGIPTHKFFFPTDKMTTAFFYGVLIHPTILKRVLNNDASHLQICPAILTVRPLLPSTLRASDIFDQTVRTTRGTKSKYVAPLQHSDVRRGGISTARQAACRGVLTTHDEIFPCSQQKMPVFSFSLRIIPLSSRASGAGWCSDGSSLQRKTASVARLSLVSRRTTSRSWTCLREMHVSNPILLISS